jgi:hypothetical protein
MDEHRRDAIVSLCRDHIARVSTRMDVIRSTVERLPMADREAIERRLDHLRGLRNRALARTEAARMADDNSWDGAQAQLDQTIRDLNSELGEIETRIPS